jgi:FkbM family methyltransferase
MNSNRTPFIQAVKNSIARKGAHSKLVRLSLGSYALLRGYRVRFTDEGVQIRQNGREMIVPLKQYIEVPLMMELFNLFFATIDSVPHGGVQVLDFSKSGVHRYKRGGVSFHFPSIPEDDVMDAYTHRYTPKPGDVVWDAGANAGVTTYFLSQAVGSTGKVYAFEPDEQNYNYLLMNIARHNLANVVPVKKALAGMTGSALFQMDGTLSAGIQEYLLYADRGDTRAVPTITVPDACAEFGCVPAYVKMDIEGAEVAVIQNAAEFLKEHSIRFAIESGHPLGSQLTYQALDQLFPAMGYEVESSTHLGQMFTWAQRRS